MQTLTLALELADDGVQISVLGRDVAPADRHFPAAASARSHQRPGSPRLLLSSGSAASGSGGGSPPPGRAAGLRALPARPPVYRPLPSRALPGGLSPRLLPSSSAGELGAVRAAVLKEAARRRRGGVCGAGATSPGPNGAGAGPGLLGGGAGRGGSLQERGRASLWSFCSCSRGQWPQPL